MHVTMIGTGYVGLVSGACFSEFGHNVTCVDNDIKKIEALNRSEIPIFEPSLDRLVKSNADAGRITFTTDLEQAVAKADAVFIAVGTPSRRGDGHADLTYVFDAVRKVADALDGYTVIVTKSTVPVGTGTEVFKIIKDLRPDADFDVASNPEFLREGNAIEDFMRPDRIIVGTDSERAKEVIRELYRALFLNETPVLFTSRQTAELIKYAANAFLATKITFINEIANLCEQVDADVQDVARGIGLDGRIGSKFLHAGPGYGGSCFPKDTLALLSTAKELGLPLDIVKATADVNDRRKRDMAQKVIDACDGSLEGKTVAILGLTFKPNTDDMRESPSLDIIPALQNAGAKVRAYDPEGMDEAKKLLENIDYCDDAYKTLPNADVLVIVTEWNVFRALDMEKVKDLLKSPILVDMRNIYEPKIMRKLGFTYVSVGRPIIRP